jgi:hypothetical protein
MEKKIQNDEKELQRVIVWQRIIVSWKRRFKTCKRKKDTINRRQTTKTYKMLQKRNTPIMQKPTKNHVVTNINFVIMEQAAKE